MSEPTLAAANVAMLARPPRVARTKRGRGQMTVLVILTLLCFMGLALLAAAGGRAFLQSYGTPIRATVDRLEVDSDSEDGTSCLIHYHYQWNGDRIEDHQQVNCGEWR